MMKKPCNFTICLSPADPSTASLTIARINMRRLNTSESCPMINFGTLPGAPLPRCPSNNGRIYLAPCSGQCKAEALEQAREQPPEQAPQQAALAGSPACLDLVR